MSRTALQEGAREHAAWAAEQRPGHTGEVAFPEGKYPVTLVEAVAVVRQQAHQIEMLTARVEALERKGREIGPHTPIGPGLMPKPEYVGLTDEQKAQLCEVAAEAMAKLRVNQVPPPVTRQGCDGPMARGVE